jgi:uncharacterized protein
MLITQIWIYPIKSGQGISLSQGEVTAKGIVLDREFMIVNSSGKFITQRQFSQLATLQIKILENTHLMLSVEDDKIEPFILIPTTHNQVIPVEIWRDHTLAIDQGEEVAQWLTEALKLKEKVRLVKQSAQHIRPINPQYTTQIHAPVSFADGYPLLLTNIASLAELNNKIIQQYHHQDHIAVMSQFRPNLVVKTDQSFAEDHWQNLQIGSINFKVAKPCSRCIVTTTNQKNGQINSQQEPLKTLSNFRNFRDQGILFGVNLIPLNTGMIKLGDALIPLD